MASSPSTTAGSRAARDDDDYRSSIRTIKWDTPAVRHRSNADALQYEGRLVSSRASSPLVSGCRKIDIEEAEGSTIVQGTTTLHCRRFLCPFDVDLAVARNERQRRTGGDEAPLIFAPIIPPWLCLPQLRLALVQLVMTMIIVCPSER